MDEQNSESKEEELTGGGIGECYVSERACTVNGK